MGTDSKDRRRSVAAAAKARPFATRDSGYRESATRLGHRSAMSLPGARQLACELALAVCDAADARSGAEQQFVTRLHSARSFSRRDRHRRRGSVRALTPCCSDAARLLHIINFHQPDADIAIFAGNDCGVVAGGKGGDDRGFCVVLRRDT